MSDITLEQIAAALTGGSDVNEVLNGWVDVSAEGDVAHITYTPIKTTRWSTAPDRENALHFRAVVVEAPAYAAADGPVELPAHTARELACETVGYAVDGWTVVANEYVESGRWESLHELVIRNEAGQHFMDTYRRGLTEHQDSGPYEYETKAMFTAVVPKFKVVAEWVSAEAAQAEQNGGAS